MTTSTPASTRTPGRPRQSDERRAYLWINMLHGGSLILIGLGIYYLVIRRFHKVRRDNDVDGDTSTQDVDSDVWPPAPNDHNFFPTEMTKEEQV